MGSRNENGRGRREGGWVGVSKGREESVSCFAVLLMLDAFLSLSLSLSIGLCVCVCVFVCVFVRLLHTHPF